MNSKSPESGLDELMRLSRETARMGQDVRQKEQQEVEHYQKVQEVVQGLREISFSVALEQLKPVATAEIIEKVRSLLNKQDTKELRRSRGWRSREKTKPEKEKTGYQITEGEICRILIVDFGFSLNYIYHELTELQAMLLLIKHFEAQRFKIKTYVELASAFVSSIFGRKGK